MRDMTLALSTRTVMTGLTKNRWTTALPRGFRRARLGCRRPRSTAHRSVFQVPGPRPPLGSIHWEPSSGSSRTRRTWSHASSSTTAAARSPSLTFPGPPTQANGINPQGDISRPIQRRRRSARLALERGTPARFNSPGFSPSPSRPKSTRKATSSGDIRWARRARLTLIDGCTRAWTCRGDRHQRPRLQWHERFRDRRVGRRLRLLCLSDGVSHGFLLRHVYSWGAFDPCGNAVNGVGAAAPSRGTKCELMGIFSYPLPSPRPDHHRLAWRPSDRRARNHARRAPRDGKRQHRQEAGAVPRVPIRKRLADAF